MTRAFRIVLIASLMMLSTAVAGFSPAGAAGPTITSITALTTHAGCALMSNATVRCAGLNESGQLGIGTFGGFSLTAVTVKNTGGTGALSNVAAVSTGNYYACARLLNGTAACWGDNTYGQLGTGNTTHSAIPVAVRNATGTGPLTGIVQVSTGKYHTCARLSNGTVNCWGHNGYYELGDGGNAPHFLPRAVKSSTGKGVLTGASNLSISQYDSCVVLGTGGAYCWGLNQFGILGDGTLRAKALPTKVRAPSGNAYLANVLSISAAPEHTCALLKNHTVDCWGMNFWGQLGDGTGTNRLRPVVVKNALGNAALVNVAQLTTAGGSSGDHTCVRLVNSTAMCWGSNIWGQLGDGTRTNKSRPVAVKGTTGNAAHPNILGVFAGPIDTCALLKGGSAKCWGFNQGGQFGNGKAKNSIRAVPAAP